jgi:hypothetical protein
MVRLPMRPKVGSLISRAEHLPLCIGPLFGWQLPTFWGAAATLIDSSHLQKLPAVATRHPVKNSLDASQDQIASAVPTRGVGFKANRRRFSPFFAPGRDVGAI